MTCEIKYVSDYQIGSLDRYVGDAGLDLKFVREHTRMHDGNLIMYDTGVKISPEKGYYTMLVARSSLSKSGWGIANHVGIIDAGYRGNIYVTVFRTVPNAPELKLGEFYVQLVATPLCTISAVRVETLDETKRGTLGFGDGTAKLMGSQI